MKQTRLESAIEAAANLVIAFGISWAAQYWLTPHLFGIKQNAQQAFGIVAMFTVISFVRQYVIRRWFNAGVRFRGARVHDPVINQQKDKVC